MDYVCRDGQELIEGHRQKVMASIVKILEEGNRTGEFSVRDLEGTAEAIRIATIPFHATPVFLMFKGYGCAMEDMEEMVRKVLGLIIDGIARR